MRGIKSKAFAAVMLATMLASSIPAYAQGNGVGAVKQAEIKSTEAKRGNSDLGKEKQAIEKAKGKLQNAQDRIEKIKAIRANKEAFRAIVEQNTALRKTIVSNKAIIKEEIKRIKDGKIAVTDDKLNSVKELMTQLTNSLTALEGTTDAISEAKATLDTGAKEKDVEKVTVAFDRATVVAKERNAKLTNINDTMVKLIESLKSIQ